MIFDIVLKFELNLTIFVQILNIDPTFLHNTLHIVSALNVHIYFCNKSQLIFLSFLSEKSLYHFQGS